MKLRRILLVFAVMSGILIPSSQQAQASLIYQQNSEANPSNPTGLPNAYRIVNIETTIDSDNSDLLIVKVNFLENPRADLFAAGTSKPLLRIKIFKKYTSGAPVDGGYGDVWIDSPATAYQFMGVQSDAPVSTMSKIGASPYDQRVQLPDCKGKSWLENFGQEPWVKFSVSMSCIKLPDKFSVLAFVDADQNASYQVDYKFTPTKPMAVDISTISRPKPKDSQNVSVNQLGSYDLRTTNVNVVAYGEKINLYGDSTSPNPLVYSSKTPGICAFTSANSSSLSLISKGTCTVEVYASGDGTTSESNRAQMSFTVNPMPMQSQTLSYFAPYDVTEGDPEFEVNVTASSGLPVVLRSLNASVCYFKDPVNNPRLVTIMGPGICEFMATQDGNDRYYATSGRASFEVYEKYVPSPDNTKSPAPKAPQTKPAEKILGGTGTSAAGSTDVKTQSKTDAVAEKVVVKKTVKCKKGNQVTIKEGTTCPKNYTKIK